MKTAISIPDEIYAEAEKLASALGWSRSKLYTTAVTEFLNKNTTNPVTAALNELAHEFEKERTPDFAKELIEQGLWEW